MNQVLTTKDIVIKDLRAIFMIDNNSTQATEKDGVFKIKKTFLSRWQVVQSISNYFENNNQHKLLVNLTIEGFGVNSTKFYIE